MADTGQSFPGMGKVFFLEPEGNVDQGDQYRNLHQRSDNRCKGLAGIDTEYGDGHGDGELEVVGGSRKRKGGGLLVCGSHLHGHEKGNQKHDQEIDGQRDRNSNNVKGQLNNIFTLQRKHDDDGEKEKHQGKGADHGDQFFLIPLLTLQAQTDETGQHPGDKGDTKVNKD
ncbi:hypothetical protein UWK_00523 [Desulfocapsa sulfexigens DSM 10523]|uniref:Uncharacterized protein n=1 Tax=Desulfocapsa sulfexigens (strain DSM 10523 / SB164P1) TaxID=1167006 RepID=M1NBC4_DESSD|nr:hypothetical protein UWK_00523 [Desulfocapsa sulfexigens DSM 10523]